jgi:hypothetical protein
MKRGFAIDLVVIDLAVIDLVTMDLVTMDLEQEPSEFECKGAEAGSGPVSNCVERCDRHCARGAICLTMSGFRPVN